MHSASARSTLQDLALRGHGRLDQNLGLGVKNAPLRNLPYLEECHRHAVYRFDDVERGRGLPLLRKHHR